jgi:hypothetical protein
MRREGLIQLFEHAFERAAGRLRTQRHDDPWEIIRLLCERSRTVMATLK